MNSRHPITTPNATSSRISPMRPPLPERDPAKPESVTLNLPGHPLLWAFGVCAAIIYFAPTLAIGLMLGFYIGWSWGRKR